MYTRCEVIFVLPIKDIFTPIKHLAFLHFSFHCYPPGCDHSIPYLDHSHTLVTDLPSTILVPLHTMCKSEHVALLETLQWSLRWSLNKTRTLTTAMGSCFPQVLSPECSHFGINSKLMKEDIGVRPMKTKTSVFFLKTHLFGKQMCSYNQTFLGARISL